MGMKRADGTIEDSCLGKLEPGEQFFVLRARDVTAAACVECWVGMNLSHLGPHSKKLVEAQEMASAMMEYPHRRLAD